MSVSPEAYTERGPLYVQQLTDKVDRLSELTGTLLRAQQAGKRAYSFRQTVGFNTDGSGNADTQTYQVPASMVCMVHRVLVEIQGQNPGSAAIASAFLSLHRIITRGGITVGSMLDFLPNLQAASGLALPALMSAAANGGYYLRSNEELWLHFVGNTLTNKQGAVTVQGIVYEQGGIHMESD